MTWLRTLLLPGVICLLGVSLAVTGAIGYRVYQRMRWYEEQFNHLILDPYQLKAFAPNDPLPRQPEIKRVVFFGDSRAAAWPAPQGLEGVEFLNRGLDSQSAVQAAGRFLEHVAPLQPDVVVLQVGANDLRVAAKYPDQEREIYASCLESIRKIVTDAQALGARVVLVTIFPTGEANLLRKWNGQGDALQRLIKEANAELALLAGDGVVLLESEAVLVGEDGRVKPEYQLDELHINERGYEMLNVGLVKLLEK